MRYIKYLMWMFLPAFKLSMADGDGGGGDGGGAGGDDYISSIPEEYRDVPSVRDAGSMENLLKQHVNLESKMGNSLSFPTDDADEGQLNEFYSKVQERSAGLTRIPTGDDEKEWTGLYTKLGMPKEAGDYTLPEIKYGEGDNQKTLDQGSYGEAFREHAHKLGLSGKQFTGIMSYFGNQTVANIETDSEKYDTAMTALKAEWGDATDARVARVQQLVKEQGGDDVINAMGELGNHPAILMMLDKIANSMMEENSLGDQGPTGDAATRTSIEDEVATLKGNEAYMDRRHPDHERTVKRVDALYKKLEGYKQAA